jgi:Ca2+-binding EF-hand superfamily protein
LASKIFNNIDKKKEGKLHAENLSEYFTEYTESSVSIILREIDLNTDGVITKSEWLAYWEYVRMAGYNDKAIYKSVPHETFSSKK